MTSQDGDQERQKSLERPAAFLKLAHKKLACEQHELLCLHSESARQSYLERTCLDLAADAINDFVRTAKSCTGQVIDTKAINHLQDVQRHFLDDKTQLVNQQHQTDESANRLYAKQYQVTRQQARFISLVEWLAYQPVPTHELDRFLAQPYAEKEMSSVLTTDEWVPDDDTTFQAMLETSEHGSSPDLSRADENAFEFDTDTSFSGPTEAEEDDLCSNAVSDRIWTETMWQIIDDQLQSGSGKGTKGDG